LKEKNVLYECSEAKRVDRAGDEDEDEDEDVGARLLQGCKGG
jgi:hypothetical protein